VNDKLEKWRIEELVLVLKDLVSTLHQSENREWANVFDHFLGEAESLLLKDSIRIGACRQLVQNILCCFLEGDSFRRMTLIPGESEEHQVKNIHFRRLKARLYHVLTELQSRFVEYVN
jgi:hypothetical protein